MLTYRLLDRALAFISTIVLARLLLPADFGLVAMATAVVALIELLSAFSLEVSLIQHASPQRKHYDTVWTLRMLLVGLVSVVTSLLAWPAASFYEDPRVTPLLLVLAANICISGFENIGIINFRRELDFKRDFIFMMVKRAFAMPVTLTLAFLFQSYWALVLGVLAGTLGSVGASYLMHRYRPRFSLESWREVMSFSVWLFIFNLLQFAQLRLSHFVLGRSHGATALGVFSVATDVAALASSEITAPINRALLPGLSRLGEQSGGVREGLLRVSSVVLLVTLPASAGLAAVAEPLVLTLLGSNWLEAVPILQVLAFAGAMQSVTACNHSAFLASARSFVPVVVASMYVAALAFAMYLFLSLGALGMALAHLAASAVTMAVSAEMLRRHVGTTAMSLLRIAWRPLVAAVTMGAAVYSLDLRLAVAEWSPIPRLLTCVGLGAVLYPPLVLLLWVLAGRVPGVERMLLDRLPERLRRGSRHAG